MNHSHRLTLGGAIGLLLIIGCFIGIRQHQQATSLKHATFDPVFEQYLSAYTTGEISRTSDIQVRFSENMISEEFVGQELDENPFDFSPEIEGKAIWQNTRTLAFVPAETLEANQLFQSTLNTKALNDSLPEMPKAFHFQFKTMPRELEVEVTATRTVDEQNFKWQRLEGQIKTLDKENAETIEKIFSAQQEDRTLKVKWEHEESSYLHAFSIDSIVREEEPSEVLLAWNGKGLNWDLLGRKKVEVPAIGQFTHTNTYTYNGTDQRVVLEFSDPLDQTQDLEGLIHLPETELTYLVEGNLLTLYPKKQLTGTFNLNIEAGISNLRGTETKQATKVDVTFDKVEPQVRLVGKGTILPKSNTLPFIFESKGLRAIDVRVIKILEKNIPQFLQVNQLDGQRELRRVGQLVANKKIELDTRNDLNLNSWTKHSLDLASLINTDPGAIYEVAIGFRQSYSLYDCIETEEDRDMLALPANWNGSRPDNENSYWDGYYYNYRDRDDPCKAAYYYAGRAVKRNVLASDLGIIAKRGDNGSFFTVTDLKTTRPMANVDIEVFSYQQQVLSRAKTDADGIARADYDETPYLLVAKSGNQRGYVRMDGGSALSLSRFDIAGQKYQKGVKGFIYGERGVWRPGDDMFLTFMLEDEAQTLPDGHPVIFELFDVHGQSVDRQVLNDGLNGFYHFRTRTAIDAPTGNYLAKVQVGGSTFRKNLKVETIKPNRLKLELDFGVDKLTPANSNRNALLNVRWLHGALAPNLDAKVSVNINQATTSFPEYSLFNFDDPIRKFRTEEKVLFENALDEQGQAEIEANISAKGQAPGMLMANFFTQAFEPGGDFSTDRFSIPYYPYNNYIGIKLPKGDAARGMLLTDIDHTVEIVTVDANGKPVSLNNLEVKLYEVRWRWWWDKSEDNLANYQGKVNVQALQTGTVSTINGKGTWKLRVNYPEWGRYLVRVTDPNGGHATGQIVYIDWPGWAGRAQTEAGGGASMLNFTADKPAYKVGEQITLNIPTGFEGRALVSLETGSKVLESYWVDAKKGMTKFSFTAKQEMAPNIYANVTLLQPHAQTKNDLPIRMYGVIPIKVEDPATHIQPLLAMADVLEPNSTVNIAVSEATGQAMTYTLAMVDEGLLDLTRFQTPDPWGHFYQREALNVKSWDIYDHVLGAYGGEIKSLLSIGGDDDGVGKEGAKPNRFKPVVKFLGPFSLAAGDRKQHQIQMPNYVGSVRTMVVAGKGTAYGSAEKATPVKKPLMVLGTLPRVLGPGETLQLPVSIFTMDDNIQDVQVQVSTKGLVKVVGGQAKRLNMNGKQERLTSFGLEVDEKIGSGSIKITAISGNNRAVYETDIEIRVPNPRISDVYAKTIEAKASWAPSYAPVGMEGTNHGVLEVSAIPPVNLGKRLRYLIHYPYGCIEQTTSSVFPQVYLTTLMDLSDGQKEKIDKNIRAGIDRVKLFQVMEGGLSYWPGNGDAHEWATNYGGHFMLEAEKTGYKLPSGFKDKWIAFQRRKASSWSGGDRNAQLTQAYRLYLLALAGKADMGAMNRMRQSGNLYTAAKWNLAAAYHLAGQKRVAKQLSNNLSLDVPNYNELSGTFGSTLRDQAIILQALSIMGERAKATPLMQIISAQLGREKWLSTQQTAYCLVAIAKYAGEGGVSNELNFAYRQNGGKWQDIKTNKSLWQLEMENVKKGKVEFKNKGEGLMYARIILDGIPMSGATSDVSNGINLDINFKNMDGQLISPGKIEQGTDFVAEVTVQHTGTLPAYEELALNQILPSGWEIYNHRLDGRDPGGDKAEYQDIRDDRIYSFFDLKQGEKKTFRVMLNASYQGKYFMPTVSVEAMYDRSINARRRGQWVEVLPSSYSD